MLNTRIFRDTTDLSKQQAAEIAIGLRGKDLQTPEEQYDSEPVAWIIDGYNIGDRYVVDTNGIVWDTTPKGKKGKPAVQLAIEKTGTKRRVTIALPDGRHKKMAIHRLVAATFVGTQADVEGQDVHHIDGNPDNNSPRNLMILPHAVHMHIEAELKHKGMKRARYGRNEIIMTQLLHRDLRESVSSIARLTGLHTGTVQSILEQTAKARRESHRAQHEKVARELGHILRRSES